MAIGGVEKFQPCVCVTLRQATRSVTKVFDKALRPVGLRATQFHTLAEIQAAGEVSVTDLTRLLLIDQTTLTRNLVLLERDGLIKEVPKTDRRIKAIRLTQKGERTLSRAVPLWASVQKQITNAMGAGTWASLSAELQLLARLQQS